MVQRFVPEVAVQQVGTDGLGVMGLGERPVVHVLDEGVADLTREVEHAADRQRIGAPVSVQPGGERGFIGDVERCQDDSCPERLQFLDEGGGTAGGGGGVQLPPGGALRQRGASDQDQTARPTPDERPAEQSAERSEGAGDQVVRVGAQLQREGVRQLFGLPDAAGAAVRAAECDLLLVVAQELTQQRVGLGAAALVARRTGVQVDQFAGVGGQLLVPEHPAHSPRGRSQRLDGLAGFDVLGATGHDAATAVPRRSSVRASAISE